MHNDKEKFERVLALLPERFVDDFLHYDLWNANYPRDKNHVLEEYHNTKNDILNQFKNKKIQKAYTDFNRSFGTLYSYLLTHFYYPEAHTRRTDGFNFLYLEPFWHHNFYMSEGNDGDWQEISNKWDSFKRELEQICSEFNNSYENFLKVGKTELDVAKPFWKSGLFWTAIGSVATVLALVFSF